MNTYDVLFFGGLKTYFPLGATVELPDGATVQALIEQLSLQNKEAIALLTVCAIAVDKKVAGKTEMLRPGVKIALLPPFSGG
jgi:molybdopterin converting factor small subunit